MSQTNIGTGLNNTLKTKPRIFGIDVPVFIIMVVIALIGMYLEVLPNNIVTGFALTMIFGALLMWVGNKIPGFGMIGGGAILCVLVPSILVYYNLFPESMASFSSEFFSSLGFSDFVVAGLVVGSLLGMDRKVLVNAGIRFFIPIAAAVIIALLGAGLLGFITGFGFAEAIFYVAFPIMGGGIAVGAVPMSEMLASYGGGTSADYLGMLIPAVMVGNLICIFVAGVLNGMGKKWKYKYKGFNGEGIMLRAGGDSKQSNQEKEKRSLESIIANLAIGCMMAGCLFIFGQVVGSFIDFAHPFVWMILGATLLKIFNVVPSHLEKAADDWYTFIANTWIPAMLVTVSAGLIKFQDVVSIFSDPLYLFLVVITVILAAIGAGFIGHLVGLYFIESSITAGLGMADMGGSGDVAVLGASERMGLLPFLQISSRIGGSLMLLVLSFLAPLLL